MAMDQFIKFDGIKGESKDSKHATDIDVLAWSWGASNSASFGQGQGGGAGKVNIQDLSITKYVDSASPTLLQMCCNGKHIKDANLFVRKMGEHPLEYIKITLTDVIVSSISTGGSGGEDRLTENISLAFAKVKFVYTPQDDKGAASPAITSGWDLLKNEASTT